MKDIDYVTEPNTYRTFLPFNYTHPKIDFFPWAGLERPSPLLLVGNAKPLHHQGYHAGNAAY